MFLHSKFSNSSIQFRLIFPDYMSCCCQFAVRFYFFNETEKQNEHISDKRTISRLHEILFVCTMNRQRGWGEVEKACQVGWEPQQKALPTTLHPTITAHWDTNNLCGFSASREFQFGPMRACFVFLGFVWAASPSSSGITTQYSDTYSIRECFGL